jgi:hypothetical protein
LLGPDGMPSRATAAGAARLRAATAVAAAAMARVVRM